MRRRIVRIGTKGKTKQSKERCWLAQELETKVALIQALIPIGLEAVAEELKREVELLTGAKHSRQEGLPGHYRCEKKGTLIPKRLKKRGSNLTYLLSTITPYILQFLKTLPQKKEDL